ncbi:peptidase M22 [Ruminococcus sp. HUN007]|uniref:peptidase M22 n=1 Tax=Ruminococcus sp. HUN007 TaxID=1514668 RepID=UPI0005D15D81|nr:peptidase M22 [Ruminococcus sp. HUN007]
MGCFLGIDTSNYTTSVALYDSVTGEMKQQKKLLPVAKGNLGLRQSDAVFHHTKQLPDLVEALTSDIVLTAIGVSVKPRLAEGSYMPCFLCGEGLARSLAAITGAELYRTSHQTGHILAALYSAGRLDLISQEFIAFHVSGGTTDCLICRPDDENIINITQAGTSLDLKAGQAVDRAGLMLDLAFPCGAALEKLASESRREFKVKPVIRGTDCSLSGLENKCRKMKEENQPAEDIALFCLTYVCETVKAMTAAALEKYGNMPVVFAGGVMSDRIIREKLEKEFDAYFAEPEFSCDNASGLAVYAKIKSGVQIY